MTSPPRRKPTAVRPPPPRDAGRILGVAAILLMVLFAPGLLAILGRPSSGSDNHEATGYNRVVGLLGSRGWLISHRDEEERGQPVVTVSHRLQREQASFKPFYRNSFLRVDIQADNPSLWQFAGRRVKGVDPNAHSVIGPFAQQRLWRGDVLFRGEVHRDLVLEGDNGKQFVFLPRDPGWAPETGLPATGVAHPFTTKLEDAPSVGFTLLDPSGAAMGSVIRVGDTLVVAVEDPAVGEVAVERTPVSPRELHVAYRPIRPEERLVLRALDGRQATYKFSDSAQNLSTFEGPGHRRRAPGVDPFAAPLEAAMSRAVQTGEPDWSSRSIRTSLDRQLQIQTQADFSLFCTRLRDGLEGKHTFRGAVLAMDALTGEVLTAASFPATRGDLTTEERASSEGLRLLNQNYNFTRLNIGSAAKIPFSMAIMDTFPDLRTLVIPPGPGKRFSEVLGQRIEPPDLPDDPTPGPMHFNEFIRLSSNRYASALFLLASAPSLTTFGKIEAGPGGYQINGVSHATLPEGAYYTVPTPGGPQLNRTAYSPISQMAWVPRMARLFDLPHMSDVGEHGDRLGGGFDLYDVGPWDGLIQHRRDPTFRGFLEVSPELESFGMSSIHSLRNDYLQLILGGGRSRWTSLKVAESYSRIVTGRMIRSSFLQTGSAPNFDPVPFRADAGVAAAREQTLLPAMEEVWRVSGGTASGLMGPAFSEIVKGAPPGETIRVFAKTGTPTLETDRASPENRAVNDLLDLRILRVDPYSARLTVRGVASGDRAVVLRALRGDDDARDIISHYRVRGEDVANYIVSLGTAQRRGLLVKEDDTYFVAPDVRETGEAGILAFVIARYRNGDPRPVRAITVVVNVQAKLPEGAAGRVNPATQFAAGLVRSPRMKALLYQPLGDARPGTTPPAVAAPGASR